MVPKQAKESVRDLKPKGDTLTRNLVLGMIGFVILILGVFTVLDRQSGSSTETPLAIDQLNTTSLGAPLVGTVSEENDYGILFNPDATVQIDIWEDFQCPYCNFFEKANGSYIDELIRNKEAKVIYHMASFLGQESVRASNASYCAVEEGRFLDFHKAIYQVQGAENSGLFSAKNLITIGEKLGIKSQKFKDCVNNNDFSDNVTKVLESMPKNNVKGTPTIFINGKLWEKTSNDFNVEELKSAVEAAKK